jgi:uncharacterized membrane protein YgcG
VRTMETRNSMFRTSGAPSARSMLTSLALHALVLALLMLGAQTLLRSAPTRKERELDIVFYHPPKIAVAAPAVPLLPATATPAGAPPGAPAPAVKPRPNAPAGPDRPGKPELPPGPAEGYKVESPQPEPKPGKVGILAFKDKLASLAQDTIAPRLGAEARHGVADDVGKPSSRSMLTSATPGSSGGINVASLNRSVGGGGGGGGGGSGGGGVGGSGAGGGGGGGGMPGVGVGRATSSIASIGGNDRPKAHGGPGPARTDEEIQIVFDRYKASFYRLYNRELRNNPTLKGQMVLRLTIEPDGSVSMCALQSSDMNAPDLAAQVVSRVRTMNFGAKEGVQAVTIVYPIDFLPAA